MREIFINAESRILIEKGCAKTIGTLRLGYKNFLVTDSNVYALYSEFLNEYFDKDEIFVLGAGEESKNFSVLEQILEKMAQAGLQRNSKLFAVGGGVVGDIAGLSASLYMRGIPYIQIPTTLLAQIDSSVGGKTAIDFLGVKNLIGAFYQPTQTLIDTCFLQTLPDREWKSGFGELIKYGGLNGEIFRLLEQNIDGILNKDLSLLNELIFACIEHKAGVVTRDEKEENERKSLNLGHTTGHAIESYFTLSHGESVLYGLALETLTALRLGVCEKEYGARFLSLVKKVLQSQPYEKIELSNVEEWAKKVKFDKKNQLDKITLVVIKNVDEWTKIELDFDEYVTEMKNAVQSF